MSNLQLLELDRENLALREEVEQARELIPRLQALVGRMREELRKEHDANLWMSPSVHKEYGARDCEVCAVLADPDGQA